MFHCYFQDPLEFPAHELEKYFKVGDHVKVMRGKYEGDTGLIVRVEENVIVLFSDLTFHEVLAFIFIIVVDNGFLLIGHQQKLIGKLFSL